MNKSLYELTEEFEALTSSWDESITDDEFMQKMSEFNLEFKDKIENCGKFIKNTESNIAGIEVEIKRLQERKKSEQNKIDNLKKYMLLSMKTVCIPKYKFDLFDVRIQKNPQSVNILDEALIPDDFITVKVVRTINKTAIKNAGGCAGAEIVQTEGVRIV